MFVSHASSGSSLEVYLHGATVTSFKYLGQDLFFLSDMAVFDIKSIRGGNPIVFPQFSSQGPLPTHGFARLCLWALLEAGDGFAVLQLSETGVPAPVRALWGYPFTLTLRLSFSGPTLQSEITVENPRGASAPFVFDCMQHAYISLGNPRSSSVPSATLEGADGLNFFDRVAAPGTDCKRLTTQETGSPLVLVGDVERIFVTPFHNNDGGVLVKGIHSPTFHAVRVQHSASIFQGLFKSIDSNLLVFKPSQERAGMIGGFAPTDYETFVAVEPGCVLPSHQVTLSPNETFKLSVSFTMM